MRLHHHRFSVKNVLNLIPINVNHLYRGGGGFVHGSIFVEWAQFDHLFPVPPILL